MVNEAQQQDPAGQVGFHNGNRGGRYSLVDGMCRIQQVKSRDPQLRMVLIIEFLSDRRIPKGNRLRRQAPLRTRDPEIANGRDAEDPRQRVGCLHGIFLQPRARLLGRI